MTDQAKTNKVWVDCPYCGGTGEGDPDDASPDDHTLPCWGCDGACGWWVNAPQPEGE